MTTAFCGWSRASKRIARVNGVTNSSWAGSWRYYSRTFIQEDDILLLKKKGDDTSTPILTKPLRKGGKTQTHRGSIEHDSLIGSAIRDVVTSTKKTAFRIHQPTLAEYVTFTPRVVTPVYPADANLIISLLDLNPPAATAEPLTDGPLEIFEAGTGHGALTLHLARAIHGANTPAPPLPPLQTPDSASGRKLQSMHADLSSSDASEPLVEEAELNQEAKAQIATYEAWLAKRNAIIHSLDVSRHHSMHARGIVRNFRQGIYYPHVDFHIGTIEDYLSTRLSVSPNPFLEHAVLDLPGCHDYLDIIGQALKPNGCLIVFCPSVTQIIKCINRVKEERLPLLLETTLELGGGAGVGGREWDVRAVKPRALLKNEAEARRQMEEAVLEVPSDSEDGSDSTEQSPDQSQNSGWEVVCRPKVGARVTGGGFLGLFRRMEQY